MAGEIDPETALDLVPSITTAKYGTANDLAARRAMAQALMKYSMEDIKGGPIGVVANLLNRGAAQIGLNQSNEREKFSRGYDADKMTKAWREGITSPGVVPPPSGAVPRAEVPAPARAAAIAPDGRMPEVTPAMATDREPVLPSKKVWGDAEAVQAGLYDPPKGAPVGMASDPNYTVAALRAGTAVAPSGAPTRAPVVPPATSVGGAPPASVFPTRPTMSDEGLRTALSSTWLDPSVSAATANMFLGQNSPVTVDTATGQWIRGKDGQVHFSPKTYEKTIKGAGGSEAPVFYKGTPTGGITDMSVGDGTPSGAPKIAPPSAADEPPAPIKGPMPKGKSTVEGPKPSTSAALPLTTEMSAAKRMPGGTPVEPEAPAGMLGVKVPEGLAPELASTTEAPAPGGEKSAQLSDHTRRMLDELEQRGLAYEGNKQYIDKDVGAHRKATDELTTIGRKALNGRPEIEFAQSLIKNPNFVAGSFAPIMDQIQRFKATFGIDPTASAPNEIFDKIMSRAILDDLKISLGGLGQVRVAEIDLLKQATANRTMSKEGMGRVTDMMLRLHDDAAEMGKIANSYERGYRLGDNGQWKTDRSGTPVKVGERPTTSGLTEQLRLYAESHPLLTKDEMTKLAGELMPKGAATGTPAPGQTRTQRRDELKAKRALPPGAPPLPPGFE